MYNLITKIQYKEFKTKIKGYSIDEVDEFLDEISEEINQLTLDKRKSDNKVEELEEKIEGMVGMEKTLQKALMLAQNMADKSKFYGEQEVSSKISEANELAKKTVEEALSEKERLEGDIERLKLSFDNYKQRMVDFMSMQQANFEDSVMQIERPDESSDISSESSEEDGLIRG